MAFRFGDPGGRIYGTAGTNAVNILALWTACGDTTRWSVSAGTGRTNGSSLRATNMNGNVYLVKTISSPVQTLGIAFAFRYATQPAAVLIASFYDNGTNQVDLRLLASGTLQVTRNGTVLGTSTFAFSVNAYHHIEFKVKIDPSVGTVEVRVDGIAVIGPLTAQNTRNTANSSANQLFIGNPVSGNNAGGSNFDFDDIILWDSTTTDPQGNPDISDFIGDCGLIWLLPNAAGTTTQFTPDSGANYTRVNETIPDGDTSYVEDGVIGHIDTYNIASLPSNVVTVKSLAVVSYTRKSDFSPRGMKHELRTNSTNVAHTTEIALSDSYTYYMSTWGQNPTSTPAAWTVTDVNNLEIGRQVTS